MRERDLRIKAIEAVRTLVRRGVLGAGLKDAPARVAARDRAQLVLRQMRTITRIQRRREALEHVDLGGEA